MIDWQKLPDDSLLQNADVQRVTEKWQASVTGGFKQEIRFFDFQSNGKPFTQVATLLTPEKPLAVQGKRVVFVASEGGHDNGREFFIDDLRREGPGVWLAKRGVTFIALTRLGRWNFLTDKPYGSW